MAATTQGNFSRGLEKFIDPSFLKNQKPKLPGGEWPTDLLRKKSFADLQRLWFVLLRERNKLLTMKLHYFRHMEELQALPAPSRVDMVRKSMENIRTVMKERDKAATERAMQIFEERLKKGIYRYPPGPQPPPGTDVRTSTLRITCASRPKEDELRHVFGDGTVFESHKGVVSIHVELPENVLESKRVAEETWESWVLSKRVYRDYHKYDAVDSVFDKISFELAPGTYDSGSRAVELPVPSPINALAPPMDPLERVAWEDRSPIERTVTQLGHFPHATVPVPEKPSARPLHPDEIEGPWVAVMVFDSLDGAAQAHAKGITEISNCEVRTEVLVTAPQPYATTCPFYDEAKRREAAYQYREKHIPEIPTWSERYDSALKRSLDEIVVHNWDNSIEYAEKEARLTNTSLYESPVAIDYTCGKSYQIPTWADPDDRWDRELPQRPMESINY